MCEIVLNILGQNVPKNQARKTISSLHIKSTKIFELNQLFVAKCFNTYILYTLKALLSKN